MMNFIKGNIKTLVSCYFYFLVIAVVAVTFLPLWPFFNGLIIPKYLLLFGPRWWLLILIAVVCFFWSYLNIKKRLFLPIIILGAFNYLDFQVPSLNYYMQTKPAENNTVKIIQANIGGGSSLHEIQLIVNNEQPDILLLQEARNINISKFVSLEYRTSCKGGLCILSKLDFEETDALSRKLINGWGNFAMLYKIKTAQGYFSLANIHLETPRTVIMSFIHRIWNQAEADSLEEKRQYEALLISTWLQSQENVIIAGDFNMTEDENIYREYFSSLNNAIGMAGFGLNYTKKTSWHGARIDHLLFSDNFVLKESNVLNALTGDHKPIVSKISFNNE